MRLRALFNKAVNDLKISRPGLATTTFVYIITAWMDRNPDLGKSALAIQCGYGNAHHRKGE
jgi:hypothetical protein